MQYNQPTLKKASNGIQQETSHPPLFVLDRTELWSSRMGNTAPRLIMKHMNVCQLYQVKACGRRSLHLFNEDNHLRKKHVTRKWLLWHKCTVNSNYTVTATQKFSAVLSKIRSRTCKGGLSQTAFLDKIMFLSRHVTEPTSSEAPVSKQK